ncbi:thioredoxin family protein [Halogranum amylolyticum]|nr:thioredoxin family protein [Halogranum amylolyticum]
MESRKILTLAFFALVLSVGYYSMNAAPVQSDQSYSYHGETKWQTNVTAVQETAAAEDKPVLIYFWTTWCTYCEDYNEKVYSDSTVQDELDEFVLLAINLDSDRSAATELRQQYDVSYPPQHVTVTADGEQITRLPGYAPKEDFLTYLERSQRQAES